jgi:hypothetical protein
MPSTPAPRPSTRQRENVSRHELKLGR